MGQMIDIPRPDGGSIYAYRSEIDPARPGVIVLQEWWGLNDHIKAIVDRFDADGYNALAPDLYRGEVTTDPDEASHKMDTLDFQEAVHQDVAAALVYFKTINPTVAIMGYCMGGALAIASGARLGGFSGVVAFYGVPPIEFADPAQITAPFQAHFATQDKWITPDVAKNLETYMRAGGRLPEMHHYDADHAFCNSTRPEVYNEAAAELAWERMIDFFGDYL